MRADFDRKTQTWFIESPLALDIYQKNRVVKYLKEMYASRIKGEIGERRKRMEQAVSQLSVNSLEVRLIGKDEKTLYLEPNSKL